MGRERCKGERWGKGEREGQKEEEMKEGRDRGRRKRTEAKNKGLRGLVSAAI